MKILVIDDEQDICNILQYRLEMEGYEVDTANSAEEALLRGVENYSLLLLDVMMDGMSGFDLARQLKAQPATADVPIIFITALGNEDNVVKGLNLGADDYIAKPISLKILVARVRAVLRKSERDVIPPQLENVISYQTLVIDLEAKVVTIDGERLPTTRIEFELLRVLVGNPDRVWSREELLRQCWPGDVCVLDRTVDVNITRLRKKIGVYGAQLKTRIGYGYTFEI